MSEVEQHAPKVTFTARIATAVGVAPMVTFVHNATPPDVNAFATVAWGVGTAETFWSATTVTVTIWGQESALEGD